ncbi:MAG: ornithine cyclodeaminase family protein [Anaerolineae bacterium]|jgi:ornithine cyclodeaminase/alanine dehydrogenase-like protein (mu-crystallin family)|nr:ornithine cyclodeaminase family protein [Anaerolineae bacterium]MBT7075088.1 ornithine cyclodeaminase family protein [Anaerolineae bacterium]MBT7782834.1 ornithine cyclodeaminase family protein [Anaerolineae bacterium]
MTENKLLYLSQKDVVSVGLGMADVIELLERAFNEKGHGRVEMPPKPGIHPGDNDNFIHAMPAYIPALNSAGIKWVGGFPGNAEKGLPYITGLLILNDPETGIPLAVMDCEWITAMRTAAASAVSARRLARKDSSTLGVLGCGVQGFTNTEALNVDFPIKEVFAYDTSEKSLKVYQEKVAKLGLKVTVVNTPKEAVQGCDLVITAGPILKEPHKTLKAGWLEEGSFATLIDFDSYLDPAALKEADKFCTDDLAQYKYYQSAGYFQDVPPVHADLGELVAGKKLGRESKTERTVACNLGLALDDMAVAPTLYKRAVEMGIGTWLPL